MFSHKVQYAVKTICQLKRTYFRVSTCIALRKEESFLLSEFMKMALLSFKVSSLFRTVVYLEYFEKDERNEGF